MLKNYILTRKCITRLVICVLSILFFYYFIQYNLLLIKINFALDNFRVYGYAAVDTQSMSDENRKGYYRYVDMYYPSNSRLIYSGESLDEIVEKGRKITLMLLNERMLTTRGCCYACPKAVLPTQNPASNGQTDENCQR